MTQDDEVQRGENAARLLNDPLFSECMQKLKDEIIAQWSATPARDMDGREWLWQFHQVALKFEELLKSAMQTGKMAKLKQEQSLKERAMSIWNR